MLGEPATDVGGWIALMLDSPRHMVDAYLSAIPELGVLCFLLLIDLYFDIDPVDFC